MYVKSKTNKQNKIQRKYECWYSRRGDGWHCDNVGNGHGVNDGRHHVLEAARIPKLAEA